MTVRAVTAGEDYLVQLLDAGYVLRVREPGHRLVRTSTRDARIHLLKVDDPAAGDYLLLRDRLRDGANEPCLDESIKRAPTAQDWAAMNTYAEAKTDVIREIKGRAKRAL